MPLSLVGRDWVGSEQPEHDLQGFVDGTELGLRQSGNAPTEAGSIESADLFREDLRSPAGDFDLGAKDGQ